jgi:hypothetical protein
MARNGEARITFDSTSQAEIGHTRRVIRADQDIGGLEVTV